MRSGGGVLPMKHSTLPPSPLMAYCTASLEIMGGPASKRTRSGPGRAGAGGGGQAAPQAAHRSRRGAPPSRPRRSEARWRGRCRCRHRPGSRTSTAAGCCYSGPGQREQPRVGSQEAWAPGCEGGPALDAVERKQEGPQVNSRKGKGCIPRSQTEPRRCLPSRQPGLVGAQRPVAWRFPEDTTSLTPLLGLSLPNRVGGFPPKSLSPRLQPVQSVLPAIRSGLIHPVRGSPSAAPCRHGTVQLRCREKRVSMASTGFRVPGPSTRPAAACPHRTPPSHLRPTPCSGRPGRAASVLPCLNPFWSR